MAAIAPQPAEDVPAVLETAQAIVTAEEVRTSQLHTVLHTISSAGTRLTAVLSGDPNEPYYWEADGAAGAAAAPPVAKVITHNLHWLAIRTWSGMETVGEFFAEILGLYNSRYEWAMDMQRRQEAEDEDREIREERQKRWAEIRALREAEEAEKAARGEGGGDGAGALAPSLGPADADGAGAGASGTAGAGSGATSSESATGSNVV
jgi:hypothetical protein